MSATTTPRRRGRRPNQWLPAARELEAIAEDLEQRAGRIREAAAALRGTGPYPAIEALRDPAYRRGQNPDSASSAGANSR